MQDAPDARPLVVTGGAIDFRNVSFSYPSGQTVLKDFMLDVPGGQKVGLVGRSGAGKSTIIALLQRLYDPDSGEVLIDGQNIAHVTQESLRSSIAVVQQDISLFHRSLLENLRYGRPEASDEEVYRAVEAARCTEFIQRLPQGFDTLVGERGMKLSGGQRQRLAIARAFLMNAPIVLLDEATSALDTESEQSIQEALARLFRGRTVIAIAHRLSTLDAFDRIVVLDRGRIVEDGPPRRLLQIKGGVYSRMYGRQLRTRRAGARPMSIRRYARRKLRWLALGSAGWMTLLVLAAVRPARRDSARGWRLRRRRRRRRARPLRRRPRTRPPRRAICGVGRAASRGRDAAAGTPVAHAGTPCLGDSGERLKHGKQRRQDAAPLRSRPPSTAEAPQAQAGSGAANPGGHRAARRRRLRMRWSMRRSARSALRSTRFSART